MMRLFQGVQWHLTFCASLKGRKKAITQSAELDCLSFPFQCLISVRKVNNAFSFA